VALRASQLAKEHRVIIFTLYLETEAVLKVELERWGVKYKTFEELAEWKKGTEPVLLGRIKAHGKGGNVPEASIVMMVDMDFVPANNLQAENRIDRPEQKREMKILYYVTEGEDVIDAHVRAINQEKAKRIAEFMRPFTPEELQSMPARVDALKKKYGRCFDRLGA
jgi:SNF2 family DNA or RNA helicase